LDIGDLFLARRGIGESTRAPTANAATTAIATRRIFILDSKPATSIVYKLPSHCTTTKRPRGYPFRDKPD